MAFDYRETPCRNRIGLLKEGFIPKVIKVVRRTIGRFAKLAAATVLVLGAWFYLGGYVLDVPGRVTAKPVSLYRHFEGMLGRDAPVHIVPPGTRCRAFQANMKVLFNFRVWCGGAIYGWTDDTAAFEPPLDMDSAVQ